jgi:hypothetical protein
MGRISCEQEGGEEQEDPASCRLPFDPPNVSLV